MLVHGASSDAWYWHLVTPLLQDAGHSVVTPTLPLGSDSAGLPEYADVVVTAAGPGPVVLVGQSMGAYSASTAAGRLSATELVLVCPMIPAPGESPGQFWAATGWQGASPGPDTFLHDLPDDVRAEALARGEPAQAGRPFEDPWPLAAWPAVPTRVLIGTQDRFFPPDFQRRVCRDRMGRVPDEIDSGHLPALSRPLQLAGYLLNRA